MENIEKVEVEDVDEDVDENRIDILILITLWASIPLPHFRPHFWPNSLDLIIDLISEQSSCILEILILTLTYCWRRKRNQRKGDFRFKIWRDPLTVSLTALGISPWSQSQWRQWQGHLSSLTWSISSAASPSWLLSMTLWRLFDYKFLFWTKFIRMRQWHCGVTHEWLYENIWNRHYVCCAINLYFSWVAFILFGNLFQRGFHYRTTDNQNSRFIYQLIVYC